MLTFTGVCFRIKRKLLWREKIRRVKMPGHQDSINAIETANDTNDTKVSAPRRVGGVDSDDDKHKTRYKTKRNDRKMKKGN